MCVCGRNSENEDEAHENVLPDANTNAAMQEHLQAA